jgi:hypothetical protein
LGQKTDTLVESSKEQFNHAGDSVAQVNKDLSAFTIASNAETGDGVQADHRADRRVVPHHGAHLPGVHQ